MARAKGREGASASRTRWRDQYHAWLFHHRLSATDSLRRVLEQPWSSLLTWLVIGIALALPVGLNVALDNTQRVSASWDNPAQISVFLKTHIVEKEARQLQGELSDSQAVSSAVLVLKEAALDEFRGLSGFSDVLASLDENPLPHLVIVSPDSNLAPKAVLALRDELLARPQVDQVVLDMEWLQRLNSVMKLSRRLVFAVGGLLVMGVALVLGNTIRLAIENRREEIVIVKLVGGSDAFVRRPFLYTGLWYGVGGGVIAAILVALFLWVLKEPANNLAGLYNSHFVLRGVGVMGVLNLVILGGGLGLFGAALAVSRHLKHIEPR